MAASAENTAGRTRPFSPFEWMLALRYLRPRRKEAFISVIAGFSFIGILLGVATLVVVMAVMNGFRTELLDKILGINGHVVVQPMDSAFTDFDAVTQRIAGLPGVRSALPIIEGQALASGPAGNSSGVLSARCQGTRLARLEKISGSVGTAAACSTSTRRVAWRSGWGWRTILAWAWATG
jgi:lipoprotein-releasing system permease protein